MVQVVFEHDDTCKKWEVFVRGAADAVEARQAFSAVVLTCHQLREHLLTRTLAKEETIFYRENYVTQYKITPAV
jgi:hypothetical protein